MGRCLCAGLCMHAFIHVNDRKNKKVWEDTICACICSCLAP